MKKYKTGYTSGVFDLFHIGHLNLLKRAKDECEHLIVAVSTDELVLEYKHKKPVIPFSERKAIVEAVRYVDEVVVQENRDKIAAFEKYKFDVMFHGSDRKDDNVFIEAEKHLLKHGSCVKYLPYTKNTSSSKLIQIIEILLAEQD
ncbi:MAG: adenylyltransferase/cytidyltransferase family protein [Oscillospiraceae bacterium]|nr:adenylyltransferase/cytidyltransferase family protein [Oscillospiraceae bacterium]